MAQLWIGNVPPGTSDDELKALLVKYGFPEWDSIQHVEGDGSRPAVMIAFDKTDPLQLQKLQPAVWGDGTILDVTQLAEPWPARFAAVPGRRFSPPRAEIQPLALEELAPEYMIRISDDFRKGILEG